MPRFFVAVCLLAWVSLLGLSGCQMFGEEKTSDKDIAVITLEELVAQREKSDKVLVVDVRPAARFAEGHLPGAVSVPLPEIREGDARFREARTLVVYSGSAMDYLSAAAAKRMLALGYQHVYDYRGGLKEWEQRGQTVER